MQQAILFEEDLIPYIEGEDLKFIEWLINNDPMIWRPLPGPQQMAYESKADIIGYGGAAGGGKTDLALGKALTQHKRIAVFRKNGTEHPAFIDRLEDVLGGRDGFNGQLGIWKIKLKDGKRITLELGSMPNMGDEKKYRGRPHDLKVFDEAAEIPEIQIRFLLAWLRSVDNKQKCQALLCFNPPTTAEGRWVLDFFAPWLDPKHPCPAEPGELRYFAMVDDEEKEVSSGKSFVIKGGQICYDYIKAEHKPAEIIKPLSRTFIPARVTDNPFYSEGIYMAQLQALPEPLRSQMLYGDFTAGLEDDPWQVCPTSWVEAAMKRWHRPHKLTAMMSMGIDVARGGKDNSIIARRHENMWFDEPLVYPGTQTPDGPMLMGLVVAATRDKSPQHIDVIGVGSSPYDFLVQADQPVIGVNVAESTPEKDKSGMMSFANVRTLLWWRMREALDPANNTGIALPPDRQLLMDLTAPLWRPYGKQIVVESRDEILKRIKRSPDWATAYILALIDTPKIENIPGVHNGVQTEYDPYENNTPSQPRREYNPYG